MNEYEVVFTVVGSSAGVVRQTVTASSDYSARRLICAAYNGKARIITVHKVG